MGTNDHIPSRATRTPSRRRAEPKVVMAWSSEYSESISSLIEKVSQAGGYIGFGRTREGTALLLYIKLDDWVERLAIESDSDINRVLAEVAGEI